MVFRGDGVLLGAQREGFGMLALERFERGFADLHLLAQAPALHMPGTGGGEDGGQQCRGDVGVNHFQYRHQVSHM